jgi:transposase
MEACATAHYWARELTKLGHRVRLMPAKDVKAYVKRNKNDAAAAEAICEVGAAADHAFRPGQIGGGTPVSLTSSRANSQRSRSVSRSCWRDRALRQGRNG